jgi:hypothetical protein
MTLLKKNRGLLALGMLLATAAQAQTGPSGLVLGVAGGLSRFDDSCEGISRCDRSDRALRLNAGWGLGNGFVVEAVSFDFGKLRGSSGGIDAEFGARAQGGGVAWYLPAGGAGALFVRLGMAQVKVKARGSGFGVAVSDSESSTAAYAGIGWAWMLGQNTALELAYESTQAQYGGEKITVGAGTVGLSFRF